MKFRIVSIKAKDDEAARLFVATIVTESGSKISCTLPETSLPSMDLLETDVTREIKRVLREDLRQLELRDESEGPGGQEGGTPS